MEWGISSSILATSRCAGSEQQRRPRPHLDASNYRYFVRGASEKPGPGDLVIQEQKRQRLKAYDWLLKKFQHRDALDAALETNDPTQVVAVVEELACRKDGLSTAIGMRLASFPYHFLKQNLYFRDLCERSR